MKRLWRWLSNIDLSPDEPSLATDETRLDEFVGPFARVTLTDKRVIFTRRRKHTSISYDDVEMVSGGWFAKNSRYATSEVTEMTTYGFYIQTADYDDQAWVERAKEAAEMIQARSGRAILG